MLPLKDGTIAAHRLTDGHPLWKTELTTEQPLAADADRVYVAAAQAIHALSAADGITAWRLSPVATLTAPPLAHAGWLIAAAGGELLAIRAVDGALLWRKPVGPVASRPALDGDLLVVSIADGRVIGLDLQSGDERWERAVGSAPGEPLVIGGRVYVGTAEKTFSVLHASSGRREYQLRVGALPRGRAAADDRHVYFTAMDNVLRALDRGDGARKWKRPLTYRPAAGPVLLGAVVLVPGPVTSLPAFDSASGAPAGQVGFPGLLATLPVFVETPEGQPVVVGITGGLANIWTLSMLGPSPAPALPLQPLTALPGEVVPLPRPRPLVQ